MTQHLLFITFWFAVSAHAATTLDHYYAHAAVADETGVIAPWYTGQNGQLDFRVGVSAETLKRYPWASADQAVMPAPHFVYTSMWSIDEQGVIGTPPLENWMCGDLGQRTVSLINCMADYYRYAGDPAAFGIIKMQADYILDFAQTPEEHPWPRFPISVPVKGKPYGQCDPKGYIQLDLSADIGSAILRAYALTGDTRYFDAARHWGDVLAQHANLAPGTAPWNRYANPEEVTWSNELTGSVTLILHFLDQLIRFGYTGEGDAIIHARDAGRAYLESVLLPRWAGVDTWGRYYWDWECPVMCLAGVWAAQYLVEARDAFPNWRNDARNVLGMYIHRVCVDPASAGEVYHGAWAVPESPSCCGLSLSYGQQLVAAALAEYAAVAGDSLRREQARRMAILGSYDALDNGAVIDGLNGTPIVAGTWLNIIHPLAMRFTLQTIAWMPELFAPARENHLVRSSADIAHIAYSDGRIAYTTFDAPTNTTDVLRLAFAPTVVLADEKPLEEHKDLNQNGYSVQHLDGGDCLVTIRHDGARDMVVTGDDPQTAGPLSPTGLDEAGASLALAFEGTQVRVVGDVGEGGGLADVYLDGVKQRAGIDFWCPFEISDQIVFTRTGLKPGPHEIKVVARGEKNPRAKGIGVNINSVQTSAETTDGRPAARQDAFGPQRMVFGYTGRTDLIDAAGNAWRPATDWVVRLGANADAVEKTWWTTPVDGEITGTDSPDLYRYGAHAPEFVVNVTVQPGSTYRATVKFADTGRIDAAANRVTVLVNGTPALEKANIAEWAGGANRAKDLEIGPIAPKNGVIEFRFLGDKEANPGAEAFVQALEVWPVS